MSELSGIYKIICRTNDKFYIGSSINIDRRLKDHKRSLCENKHRNKYLQDSWNKYGEKNFKYEIIETVYGVQQLLIREKWWIDSTNCCDRKIGFNISSDPRETARGKFIDLTGQKFERLSVINESGRSKSGNIIWNCLCDCGNKITVIGSRLKNGHTKSCGCLRKDIKTIHGHNRSNKKSPTYSSWDCMIQRCTNKNNIKYKDYGGRGITVCDRWNTKKGGSFENFLEDMGEKPIEHELDRVDNNKLTNSYSLENCRWISRKQQMRNTRSNHLITYDNKTQCLSAWAEEYGMSFDRLWHRLYTSNWPIEKALLTPVKKYRKK